MKNLGEKLRSLRNSKGLSLREVSGRAGISAAYLCQLENNTRREPTLCKVLALCKALDIHLSELIPNEPAVARGVNGQAAKALKALKALDLKKVVRILEPLAKGGA